MDYIDDVVMRLIRRHDMNSEILPNRPYTPKELAAIYQCSAKTFRKWIDRMEAQVGPRVGNYFTPRQVKAILEHLGRP